MSRRNHSRCCFRRVYLPLNCLNLRRLLLRHRFQLQTSVKEIPSLNRVRSPYALPVPFDL